MTDPIYDADLIWLREQYLDEMPGVVEFIDQPGDFALEMDATNGNGLYRRWADRMAGDRFMGEYRRVLFPVHEAVKRLGPSPERRWLRYALTWRGLPCLCGHKTIAAHLAEMDRTTEDRIVGGVRYATRRVFVKADAGSFDIRSGSGNVHAGRIADSVSAVRSEGWTRRVTTGSTRIFSAPPDRKLPDAPLCACHAHLHGRPPKKSRDAAA